MNTIYCRTAESIEELQIILAIERSMGKKIVFTTGVFDLLHYGHGKYLLEVKKYGDFLVVGIDSDELVKKNKGEDRPINKETRRAFLISLFSCVDISIIFDDYFQLLRAILPDTAIFSQSNPFNTRENRTKEVALVENYGGKIIFIPKIAKDETSTGIQNRIIHLHEKRKECPRKR